MAKTGENYSPKEFSCWVIQEVTAGTTPTATSDAYALNVDSVSYPTLNVSQALDVRTGGRILRDDDFYQDNILRTVELQLSGVLHNDNGHKALLQNICNDYSGEIAVAAAYSPPPVIYGTANTATGDTLTIAIKNESEANSNMVFPGMVVTNFAITADVGTDSGRYKFSCTLASGFTPTLNDNTNFGNNAYANTTDAFLSSSSAHKVINSDVVMQNFTLTLDNPIIGVGSKTTGYEQMARGTEFAVTVDTQVKLDAQTKGHMRAFDVQTAANGTETFTVVNNGAFGVAVPKGVLTNVAYSEGDIMMLDHSIKATSDGSTALVTIDVVAD